MPVSLVALTVERSYVTLTIMPVRSPTRSRRAVTVFNDLPRLTRDGFVLVVAGGLMDTAYHLTPAGPGVLEWTGLIGHLVTLLGMLIAMGGVLTVGLRNRHP